MRKSNLSKTELQKAQRLAEQTGENRSVRRKKMRDAMKKAPEAKQSKEDVLK